MASKLYFHTPKLSLDKLEEPLSDEALYWIGYIRADGYIRQSTNRTGFVRFSQTQEHPVKEFHTFMEVTSKIVVRDKAGGFASNNKAYIATARKPYHRFVELGVKKNLREDIFQSRHFWRGLIDGDGSVNLNCRYGRTYPTLQLCSEKYSDLENFLTYTSNLGLSPAKISPTGKIFIIKFGGEQAQYLIWHLYSCAYSANKAKQTKAYGILDWRPHSWSKLDDGLRANMRASIVGGRYPI